MQLWTTTVASPRATARTAREREAAGWDGMLVVEFAEPVRRSLRRAGDGGHGDDPPRSRHRRDQQRDPPPRGYRLLDRQHPTPVRRTRGAGHRAWRFGARASRARTVPVGAIRAPSAPVAGLSARRFGALRRHRHSRHGGPADVRTGACRCPAGEPDRLDRRRGAKGAGRGRGKRTARHRYRGASRRPCHVRPRRR